MRAIITLVPVALLLLATLVGCPQRDPAIDVHSDLGAQGRVPAADAPATVGPPVSVELPAGAVQLSEGAVSGARTDEITRTWVTPFAYSGDYYAVIADLDNQLAQLDFERVVGPTTDIDPNYTSGQRMKPSRAEGRKTYISSDRTSVVRLEYRFVRGDEGTTDSETYRLVVLDFAEPHPVNAPSRVEPIT